MNWQASIVDSAFCPINCLSPCGNLYLILSLLFIDTNGRTSQICGCPANGFNLSSESNFLLPWLCISSLGDWFKKERAIFSTNQKTAWRARTRFPALCASGIICTNVCFEFWLFHLIKPRSGNLQTLHWYLQCCVISERFFSVESQTRMSTLG